MNEAGDEREEGIIYGEPPLMKPSEQLALMLNILPVFRKRDKSRKLKYLKRLSNGTTASFLFWVIIAGWHRACPYWFQFVPIGSAAPSAVIPLRLFVVTS